MIPTKLKKGDTIGVIAPSNYIEKDDLEYFSIKAENELGKLLKSKQSEDDDDEEEN